jgi:GxxExxY protein
VLYEDLTYKINGLCFKVHTKLGRFCKERQYSDELEEFFKKEGFKYMLLMDPFSPKGNKVDFLLEDSLILDVKVKKFVTKEDYLQMQRYSNAAGLELGLIINFRNTYLKPKRILNFKLKSGSSGCNLDCPDR